jgi:RNA polymerase sigma-70 factor (ECF subfamily)
MSELAAGEPTVVDAPSFERLFDEHRQRLFSALWLVARDRDEAEDLTQEAFVRVWERWDRSGPPDDPESYLFRAAMNLFLNRRRRAATAARRKLRSVEHHDHLAAVDTRDELRRALLTLTPAQRAAVVLVDVLDLSSDDAAALLHKRPATVRVLAARARAALARELGGIDG